MTAATSANLTRFLLAQNPTDDAAVIAQIMIDDRNMASIHRLHEKLGWPKRRLNPAVARLMPYCRTSEEIQNDYPAWGFSIKRRRPFPTQAFHRECANTEPFGSS